MGEPGSTCSADEYISVADSFITDHGKWARTSVQESLTRGVVEAALTAEHATPATNPGKHVLPKTVVNTTDPQSQLMPPGVDCPRDTTLSSPSPAIRSSRSTVGQSPNDIASLAPMMEASQRAAAMLHTDTGRSEYIIGVVLADAGYCSDTFCSQTGRTDSAEQDT